MRAVIMATVAVTVAFGHTPLVLQLLHMHASAYGLLFLCYAAGAVAGGLVAGRVKGLLGEGPAITVSVVSAIAGCAAIVVTGVALAPFLRTTAIADLRAATG